MTHVFLSILPIFMVMTLGFVLQQMGILNGGFVKTANNLVFRVCLPVLLFHKISHASFTGRLPILTAVVMVLLGQTVLAKRLEGLSYVLYWMVCVVMTGLAVLTALHCKS